MTTVSFLQNLADLPTVQDLGFDKQRISKYKEMLRFSFICFGIFLPASQHLFCNLNFCKDYPLSLTYSQPEGIKLLKPTLFSVTHIPIPRGLEFLQ